MPTISPGWTYASIYLLSISPMIISSISRDKFSYKQTLLLARYILIIMTKRNEALSCTCLLTLSLPFIVLIVVTSYSTFYTTSTGLNPHLVPYLMPQCLAFTFFINLGMFTGIYTLLSMLGNISFKSFLLSSSLWYSSFSTVIVLSG